MGDTIVVDILERFFKAFILLPICGAVGWWIFSGLLDKTISLGEALLGFALLAIGLVLGTACIVVGGWGFLQIVAMVFLAILALSSWEYLFFRKRTLQFLADEVARYQTAIERDPTNAAAYSYLGQTYLKQHLPAEAVAAFEKVLELDPEARREKTWLRQAREMKERR